MPTLHVLPTLLFKRAIALSLLGLLWLLSTACQSSPDVSGQWAIARIASGNTIEVIDSDGAIPLTRSVRLIGITAPDLQQDPWGRAAKQQLEDWLSGQSVQLELDIQSDDSYGRRLAYVWHDGQLVNEQLVEQGYALAEGRSPNLKYEQRFLHAQQHARILGLGIWNPDHPMRQTPDEFRQQSSSQSS